MLNTGEIIGIVVGYTIAFGLRKWITKGNKQGDFKAIEEIKIEESELDYTSIEE